MIVDKRKVTLISHALKKLISFTVSVGRHLYQLDTHAHIKKKKKYKVLNRYRNSLLKILNLEVYSLQIDPFWIYYLP